MFEHVLPGNNLTCGNELSKDRVGDWGGGILLNVGVHGSEFFTHTKNIENAECVSPQSDGNTPGSQCICLLQHNSLQADSD